MGKIVNFHCISFYLFIYFNWRLIIQSELEPIIQSGGSEVKASACTAGDRGSVSGLERSPGEGNGNPLQFSCLENPMEGGAW